MGVPPPSPETVGANLYTHSRYHTPAREEKEQDGMMTHLFRFVEARRRTDVRSLSKTAKLSSGQSSKLGGYYLEKWRGTNHIQRVT